MSNPKRARALRKLASARRSNVRRVAAGKSPIVGGKKVSAKSIGLTKKKAQDRLKRNDWKTLPKTKSGQGRYKKKGK